MPVTIFFCPCPVIWHQLRRSGCLAHSVGRLVPALPCNLTNGGPGRHCLSFGFPGWRFFFAWSASLLLRKAAKIYGKCLGANLGEEASQERCSFHSKSQGGVVAGADPRQNSWCAAEKCSLTPSLLSEQSFLAKQAYQRPKSYVQCKSISGTCSCCH